MIYTNPPKECDICKRPIENEFVDGKTLFGPWANMCMTCHLINGVGLGTGKGQHYQKDENGKFVKISG